MKRFANGVAVYPTYAAFGRRQQQLNNETIDDGPFTRVWVGVGAGFVGLVIDNQDRTGTQHLGTSASEPSENARQAALVLLYDTQYLVEYCCSLRKALDVRCYPESRAAAPLR